MGDFGGEILVGRFVWEICMGDLYKRICMGDLCGRFLVKLLFASINDIKTLNHPRSSHHSNHWTSHRALILRWGPKRSEGTPRP